MRSRLYVFVITIAATSASLSAGVVTFSDQPLAAGSFNNGGPTSNSNGFTSGGAFFNNTYESTFGSWNGWSMSKVNNTGADYPGVADYAGTHQYAAYPGGGVGGANDAYAVGYYDGFDPTYVNLAAGQRPASAQLTNTTYDVLSMSNGDSFSKKFTSTDFFSATLTGYAGPDETGANTGSTTFYLAQNGKIVTDWTLVDLTALGNASSIGITFDSSDVGAFGVNTPTYLALDNLTTVPEPVSLSLVIMGAAILLRRPRGAR